MLRSIKRRLTKPHILPFPLRDIAKYYTQFPVIMVSKGRSIFLAMILPLRETGKYYNLYRAYNLPVAYGNLLHYFEPESNYIAVAKDKSQYAYLSEQDMTVCQSGICTLKAPMYKSLDTGSCALALIEQNSGSVQEFCNIRTEPMPKIVSAHPILNTKWLILSDRPWKLDIICNVYSRGVPTNITSIQIESTVFILDLDKNCQASGRYFLLAARHTDKSSPSVDLVNAINMAKFPEVNISMSKYEFNRLTAPTPIIQLDEIDIDQKLSDLQEKLAEERFNWKGDTSTSFNWYSIIISVMAIVIVIFVIIGFLYYLRVKVILQTKRRNDLKAHTYRSIASQGEGHISEFSEISMEPSRERYENVTFPANIDGNSNRVTCTTQEL